MRITFYFFVLLLFSSAAQAQWWNPVAPKNYDECVLKNVKEGMGDTAVRAVIHSCRNQFPDGKGSNKKLDERYKKCNLQPWQETKDTRLYIFSDSGKIAYQSKTNEVISNVQKISYEYGKSIRFQNHNSFGISGLFIGHTDKKSCSSAAKDYQYTLYCKSFDSRSGVGAHTYGSLNCGPLPPEAKKFGFCVIGYSPMYTPWNDSFLEFLEREGYCN